MSILPKVSISIVSHNHGGLVASLLGDLNDHVTTPHEVILTFNVPEELPLRSDQFRFPVRIMRNPAPKGFAANHNAAFREARGEYFCVLNPDIRVTSDPFPALLECLRDPEVGVAAPVIRSSGGAVEDSARRFPTPWAILKKVFIRRIALDYAVRDAPIHPDWVAGMFMLFRRDAYSSVGGFDERYFLYYEDVDLCVRLALSGKRAVLCPAGSVIHDARRESRRNLGYVWWHLASMFRFFRSPATARVAPQKFRTPWPRNRQD